MKIAIHQSSFIPYIGYWNKLVNSNVFFDLGTFQFSPNEMYHRTFIKNESSDELKYLTVPVIRKPIYSIAETLLNEKEVNRFKESFRNHLKWYKNNVVCYHWKNVSDMINNVLNQDQKTLFEINSQFIDAIIKYLHIFTIIERNIPQNKDFHKSELLIDMINHYTNESCIYLSGSGAKEYIDIDLFNTNHIEVQFPYSTGDFFKGTIIDYIMRYSPEECLRIIKDKFIWR
jgi:hypothetical protein